MSKLPWPSDAVMIICANPEEAITSAMESVNPGNCRICGAAIVYDGFSMRRALEGPNRNGRPVKFFCIPCATMHSLDDIDVFEDHRGGTTNEFKFKQP